MLDCDNPDEEKHTFADDMESLFYVVQYCAFLWQPHAFDQCRLSMVMSRLFDTVSNTDGLGFHGGIQKKQDLIDRTFIGGDNFGSKALGEWLDAILAFRRALARSPAGYRNEWSDPASIDAFWADFLRTHTLETDNRVVHELDDTMYLNSRFPGPGPGLSSGSETRLPSSPGHKRKRGRASSEPPRRNLRRRIGARLTTDSAPPALRRSARIRDLHHKVQPQQPSARGRTRGRGAQNTLGSTSRGRSSRGKSTRGRSARGRGTKSREWI